jgi:glyoxylate reductase
MTRPQVLLLGPLNSPPKEWKQIEDIAETFVVSSQDRAEFIHDLKTKYREIVAIYGGRSIPIGRIDAELIDNFPPSLKFITHFGAGYDRVDIKALHKRGIQYSNTPVVFDETVADTGLYLLLGAIRNFSRAAYELRESKFKGATTRGNDPAGKTLGIVGLGGIGKAFRDKVAGLNFAKILYNNRSRLPKEVEKGAEYKEFEELLAQSDIIFISVPLSESTHHLFNAETLAKTKKGVIIVNIARGAVIDENALVDSLESGHVKSVGLDVFENEPKVHPKLLNNRDVTLLPHIGGFTEEGQLRVQLRAIANLKSALTHGKLIDPVSPN